MSHKIKELPDSVESGFRKLHELTGESYEFIRDEYCKILKDPFIQTDTQFQGDADRYDFALQCLWHRLTWNLDPAKLKGIFL